MIEGLDVLNMRCFQQVLSHVRINKHVVILSKRHDIIVVFPIDNLPLVILLDHWWIPEEVDELTAC